MAITGPLTATSSREINTALARLADTRNDLEKGQRAGLPVENEIATVDALVYQLEAVKREFLPTMP
jgi:hypothetical protein